MAIDDVLSAGRTLPVIVIREIRLAATATSLSAKAQGKIDALLREIDVMLQSGDTELGAGRYIKALDWYKKVYKLALKTLKRLPQPLFTLTITTAGTGSGTISGARTYSHGSLATVTATPNLGSTFAGWSGPDGVECATGSVLMTANKSCTATFTLNTYTLTITMAGTGSGTTTGAGIYDHGDIATVTATANLGSTFAGWSGLDGAECATGSVLMTANKSCMAIFTLNRYTLEITTAGTGSGTTTGAGMYNYGDTATTTATANTSSTFTGWSGTDKTECEAGSVLMTANKSCTATFTLNRYIVGNII